MRGRTHHHDTPLPGVIVTARSGAQAVTTTSTTEAGVWTLPLPSGTYTLVFALRGFVDVTRALRVDSDACAAPFDVELLVDMSPRTGPAAGAPGMPPASAPVAPRVLTLRGRDMTVNRAALRERQAALRRGDLTVDVDAWPPGLITVVPAPGATTPLVIRGGAATMPASGPLAVAPRVPRLPAVSANRLYSATTSYTVAASALDAAPYQLRPDAPARKPDYFRHSIDFSVGGPLDAGGRVVALQRITATLSYAAIRGGNLFDRYATVPTAAMRAGDFSSLAALVRDPATGTAFPGNAIPSGRLNPTARALLDFLPLPSAPGTSRNFHYTASNRSTQDTVNLRVSRPFGAQLPGGGRRAARASSATVNGQVDYRRNVNDRLSALPSIAGVGRTSTLRVPLSVNMTARNSQHAITVGLTRNTTRTQNRYAGVDDVARRAGVIGASTDPFSWGLPELSFASITSVEDLTPSERRDRRWTLGYSFSRGAGAHRIRAGAELAHATTTSRTDQNARGAFVFTGIYSGVDFADFLLGHPQQASLQYGPGTVRLSNGGTSLYVQDDWRRWSTVTLNAGIRYELVTPFTEAAGRLANLDAAPGFTSVAAVAPGDTGPSSGRFPQALVTADRNNLAPRIGLAWRAASRTTLRVGYGVSFATGGYASIARQLAAQPPYAVTNTAIGTLTQPLDLATALTGGASATTNTFGVDRNYQAGTVRTWTVDLNREMGDAWNVSGGVTYTRGSHLDRLRAPNRGPDGLRIPGAPPFLWQTSEGRSRLRSATLRVQRWYVRGFSLSANYTLARSFDDASTIGGGQTVVAQDDQDLAAEWGPSSFSRRHRLSGDVNFELPFGSDHRWLNNGGPWATLLGGLSAYITFDAQSGTPLTARVLSSASDAARGTNGTLRAQLTGAPIAVAHPTIDRAFNPEAFAVPAPGTFGNAGRNIIVGPGSRNLDLQITREVHAGSTRTLSVQVRVTNPFNLVNYAGIDTAVNSPTFGQVLSVRAMRSTQVNVRWRF